MTDRTPFARLQRIMKIKNTKVILRCDVTTMEKLAYFAESCGPYICILKVHTDIIENFSVLGKICKKFDSYSKFEFFSLNPVKYR